MSAEALQKVFKTLADPTRLRILALLEREELAVQELMEVLAMAQSRISRHLRILKEAHLLNDRREGTFVLYRMADLPDTAWEQGWAFARSQLESDPLSQRDLDSLNRVLQQRATSTRDWFDSIGPEWDGLRKMFNDDALRARAISKLIPRDLTVLEVGTGTGVLALELARLGLKVIAVDHSKGMLEAAETKLIEAGVKDQIDLRQAEADALPLSDGEVDAALAHMVLHYVPNPAAVLREMARVLRPGGQVVIVDFEKHDREWMQQELGVRWLGFEPTQLTDWMREAGFSQCQVDISPPMEQGRDLPATIIASAQK
ncbi:MAG: metalloregulator ArsR/SmtB family transcription factor [Deltaproteobacteria bacterium]|nr:metalloregulator ArsR/SmtB family transcription factor [Deltaproteobacteria bacterium]